MTTCQIFTHTSYVVPPPPRFIVNGSTHALPRTNRTYPTIA